MKFNCFSAERGSSYEFNPYAVINLWITNMGQIHGIWDNMEVMCILWLGSDVITLTRNSNVSMFVSNINLNKQQFGHKY
jgi:hypothetical protein